MTVHLAVRDNVKGWLYDPMGLLVLLGEAGAVA